MKLREFRKETGLSERPRVWYIGIDEKDPEIVVTRWGMLDGAIQETRDRPGSCGVEGHADYQTADHYALFCMARDIRRKKEHGYVEFCDGRPMCKVATVVDLDLPLPKNLTFYKPQTKISDGKLTKLEKSRKAIWTLKRDGMMHVAVGIRGDWEIYTRRMDKATERFPHIVKSLNMLDAPGKSVLLGEIVLLGDKGVDRFLDLSSICRSDPPLALAYQGMGTFPKGHENKKPLGKTAFYVFDVAFLGGDDLARYSTVRDRLSILRELFSKLDPRLRLNTGLSLDAKVHLAESRRREAMLRKHHVGPVKIFKTNSLEDIDLAKRIGAEGFVVLSADAVYGRKAYSFDGDAKRPDGIWKRKPKYEEEFIVVGTYEGTGKNSGKLGGFYIEQVHPKTGKRIKCGKCGGGLSDAQRVEYYGDDAVGWTIKVEFDSRQPPKNGVHAVRFPVFKGRSDKKPEECVAQSL